MLFQAVREASDDPSVNECTQDGAPPDAFKMSKTEHQKAQDDADHAACAVIDGFEACDAEMKMCRDLFDKQLIDFRGNIGMEHGRNARRAEEHA